MRMALSEAELEPSSISAVETHGTGTALGDPIEVGAFRNTLREGRAQDVELTLCAVKTNIGPSL